MTPKFRMGDLFIVHGRRAFPHVSTIFYVRSLPYAMYHAKPLVASDAILIYMYRMDAQEHLMLLNNELITISTYEIENCRVECIAVDFVDD